MEPLAGHGDGLAALQQLRSLVGWRRRRSRADSKERAHAAARGRGWHNDSERPGNDCGCDNPGDFSALAHLLTVPMAPMDVNSILEIVSRLL